MKTLNLLLTALVLAGAVTASAQERPTWWRFARAITFGNPGSTQFDVLRHDEHGGEVRIILSASDCPPSGASYIYSWRFEGDVRRITRGQRILVHLAARQVSGARCAVPEPVMVAGSGNWALALDRTAYPPGSYDGIGAPGYQAFYLHPEERGAGHGPSPWTVTVWDQASAPKQILAISVSTSGAPGGQLFHAALVYDAETAGAPAPGAGVAGIGFTFPRDQAVGFREVHTQGVPGDWRIDTQGLVGSIPNDVTYSYFFPPATVSRQNLSVSSTFRFIGSVDYNAAGVGIIDPGATHTTQTVLHCDLSERENHVGLRGGLNSVREGPAIAYQGLGRDVRLNTPHTLTMEVEGTTVRCLLDGETVLTASVPDLASFPNQVHPTLHIIEASAAFTDFTGPVAAKTAGAPAPAAGVAGIRFTFPRDQAVGFREVHTQNVPGDWRTDTQGLVGAIPNDVTYSYFFPPATVSRQNLSVSATFRFLQSVDYNAAGVGIIDPGATDARQSVLHCDLSERENHVGLRGGLNSVREGPAVAYQGLGRDIRLNSPHALTMEVEGTTVRCLLDGQTILTASVPDLASFPNQVHPTLHIIEANVGFTDFAATPLGRGPVR